MEGNDALKQKILMHLLYSPFKKLKNKSIHLKNKSIIFFSHSALAEVPIV